MTNFDRGAKDTTSLVGGDVLRGLGDVFAPTEGFRVPHDFANKPPIANETQTAVVWEYAATHSGDFQGIRATGQPIVLRGVTIVEVVPDKEPVFHRYIDWADVFAQLNLSTTGRPAVEEPFSLPTS